MNCCASGGRPNTSIGPLLLTVIRNAPSALRLPRCTFSCSIIIRFSAMPVSGATVQTAYQTFVPRHAEKTTNAQRQACDVPPCIPNGRMPPSMDSNAFRNDMCAATGRPAPDIACAPYSIPVLPGKAPGRTRCARKAVTAPPPRHARTAATPPESDGRAARHATGPDVFSPGPVVRISFPADGRDRPAVCSPTPVSSIRAGPRVPPSWHRPARNRCRCARPESPP